jgi:hypothetical protein
LATRLTPSRKVSRPVLLSCLYRLAYTVFSLFFFPYLFISIFLCWILFFETKWCCMYTWWLRVPRSIFDSLVSAKQSISPSGAGGIHETIGQKHATMSLF